MKLDVQTPDKTKYLQISLGFKILIQVYFNKIFTLEEMNLNKTIPT